MENSELWTPDVKLCELWTLDVRLSKPWEFHFSSVPALPAPCKVTNVLRSATAEDCSASSALAPALDKEGGETRKVWALEFWSNNLFWILLLSWLKSEIVHFVIFYLKYFEFVFRSSRAHKHYRPLILTETRGVYTVGNVFRSSRGEGGGLLLSGLLK